MIKHVVMWRLHEVAAGNKKLENIQLIKNLLMSLKSTIPEIDSLEVGENLNPSEAAFDLALITTHTDREALSAYIDHPKHKEAAAFIRKVVKERAVVDFEY